MNDTPGVKLTSVTINAASPDVIGTLMKEITDRVVASIPPDTLSNIAAEAIRNGVVIVKQSAHGFRATDSFVLSDEARSVTVKMLTPLIEKAVQQHLEKPETKELIAKLVELGITEGMRQAPMMASQVVAKRMAGLYVSNDDQIFRDQHSEEERMRFNRLVDTLMSRGVINNPI